MRRGVHRASRRRSPSVSFLNTSTMPKACPSIVSNINLRAAAVTITFAELAHHHGHL